MRRAWVEAQFNRITTHGNILVQLQELNYSLRRSYILGFPDDLPTAKVVASQPALSLEAVELALLDQNVLLPWSRRRNTESLPCSWHNPPRLYYFPTSMSIIHSGSAGYSSN